MSRLKKKILFVAAATTMVSTALLCQKLSVPEKEILRLQDERSLGGGKLIEHLSDRDKNLRFLTAIALANIQDTSTIQALVPLLHDQDLRVRAAAAFALGQMGTPSVEPHLISAIISNQDITVLSRIFEALGKCGTNHGLTTVVSYIPTASNSALKRDQAMSIARFAIRKITSERAVWFCFDLLNDNNADTRWAALYALWRSSPLGVIDLEFSKRTYVLAKLMSDKNADVRINLATLVGRSKSKEAAGLLATFQEIESKSPDWRVQVQIARSMITLVINNPNLLENLISFLGTPNDHVRIAILTALSTLPGEFINTSTAKDNLFLVLRNLALTPSKDAVLVQGEAIVTLGKFSAEQLSEVRKEIEKKKPSNIIRAKFIEALSFQPTRENIDYVLAHTGDDSVRVAMAAWDFVRRMIQPRVLNAHGIDSLFVSSLPGKLETQSRLSLGKRDAALTTLVANTFADSSIFGMCRSADLGQNVVSELLTAYEHLTTPNDIEPMQALQEAFAKIRDPKTIPVLEASLTDRNRTVSLGAARALLLITGKDYSGSIIEQPVAERPDLDWKILESIGSAQRVVIRTTKGTFTLRLRKDAAPFTVLTFFNLLKNKFYNGLTFHRVIPNFVIQGGDPRGDGWGGPGFSIRSEWSMLNFERGSVGIASSGKDTEGCQFFVTHQPTPHLDGKYTIFATVASGMDVVDKIQVGDRIVNADVR